MAEEEALAKTWRDRWTSVSDGEGGGQADVKVVVRNSGDAAQTYFLKILRHQNDLSRRSRMFREVAAYRTLRHPAIPKLIDSNASAYESPEYKLYSVVEHVPGPTLQQFIDTQGPVGARAAINLARRVLEIVEYCHREDVVHRDIKPDNLMLRGGALDDPVLVDFGLSFNLEPDRDNGTAISEEIGNRFLRLPELAPSSPFKRDPRSDVTFICGLLLFAFTGRTPVQLVNERAQMPHQRDDVRMALERATEREFVQRILEVFDRAFQIEPGHRWQTAAELNGRLAGILCPETQGQDAPERWKRIEAYVRQPHAQAAVDVVAKLRLILNAVKDVHREMSRRTSGQFSAWSTGHKGIDGAQRRTEIRLSFQRKGGAMPRSSTLFTIRVLGDELVVHVEDSQTAVTRVVSRTSLTNPELSVRDVSAIESVLLKHLEEEIASS